MVFLAHTENMKVIMHTLVVASHTARLDRSGRLRVGVSIPQEYDRIPRFMDRPLYLGTAGSLLLPTILA